MPLEEGIALCGFWRTLVDSNRDLAGGLGFAAWKQRTVAPWLWGGGEAFPFLRDGRRKVGAGRLAIWGSKVPPAVLQQLKSAGEPLVEVEDGFLRSRGLGADCIPPLSITVDRLGAYFDPAQPSELENMLQDGTFDAALLARAQALRQVIVAEGLGKYERGSTPVPRFGGDKRHILVTGQVEDDRSILTGGAGLASNADLLARVRDKAPEAYILYKPHPDVLAGHRKGVVPDALCRQLADRTVENVPISALLDMVDEVHVNTSLAGFEALLRGKQVVTHGVPFYAGWGLTDDLGPVPARRTRRCSLDELVAATLLLYPRYLDPVTGLPCPAEIVVQRLCADGSAPHEALVVLRRMQGQLMRRFRSFVA
jgi:capsular polysaccharide export protein